jgi:hypothetical protein
MDSQRGVSNSRSGRRTAMAVAIVGALLSGPFDPPISDGHEEPCKTRWEKSTAQRSRARLAQAGVRTLILWKHDVVDGTVKARKTRALQQEYDVQGRLIGISSFVNDTIAESAIYSYNPAGDMITDVDLGAGGAVTESSLFAYDDAGRVVAGYSQAASGHRTGRFEHRFDRPNRRITFLKFDASEAVDYTIEYTFAGDFDGGDYVAAVKLTAGTTPVLRVEKSLDLSGRTIEKRVFQLDQKNSYSFRYRYDDRGTLSELARVGADGRIETTTRYGIGADGLHTESRVTDARGILTAYSSYQYERVSIVK